MKVTTTITATVVTDLKRIVDQMEAVELRELELLVKNRRAELAEPTEPLVGFHERTAIQDWATAGYSRVAIAKKLREHAGITFSQARQMMIAVLGPRK